MPKVYLVDTNVLSEARKGTRANPGVRDFFREAARSRANVFLSAVTIGELRRGIELIRHRGDADQAQRLERWFARILDHYADCVLDFDAEVAQVWGKLRVPHPENALDKQIAATALIHGLTVVTRNAKDFLSAGVKVTNPFRAGSAAR